MHSHIAQLIYEGSILHDHLSIPYTILYGSLVGAISLIGIAANLVVMFAILPSAKMRRTAMNLLLLNLAVADLGYIIMSVCISCRL